MYTKKCSKYEIQRNKEYLKTLYKTVSDFKESVVGFSSEKIIDKAHSFILLNWSYDDSLLGYDRQSLLDRRVVCTGYSDLMYLFLLNCGFDIEPVGDNAHMFNRIKSERKWCYYDLTVNAFYEDKLIYGVDETELIESFEGLLPCFR